MRFILFFLLLIATPLLRAQSLHVMSYNIRLDFKGDGINQWPNRKEHVAALIRKYDPDILGIQEALHHQLQDLLRLLPDYSYCGVGRDDGKDQGEYSALLIRNSRFGILSQKTFWLSETPEIPGSKSWDAAITRIVTRARLFDKESKKEIVVLNTHFDHMGKEARKNSARIIEKTTREIYEASKTPILVTGDFNFERSDEPYEVLTHEGSILMDSKPEGDNTGTFCGFEVGAMECRAIDYIFHSPEWIVRDYKVIQDNDSKYYPSDHLPVLVAFDLTSQN